MQTTSPPSPLPSTADPARPSTGKHPPRPSTSYCRTRQQQAVLRPPLEPKLCAPIRMVDEPALGRIIVQAATPDGVLQRAKHQLDIGSVAGLPAHDPPRERIADTGQPQRPLPRGDPRDIGD